MQYDVDKTKQTHCVVCRAYRLESLERGSGTVYQPAYEVITTRIGLFKQRDRLAGLYLPVLWGLEI